MTATDLARLDTLTAYWKSCEEMKHAPEYERIAEIFAEGVRELAEERDRHKAGEAGMRRFHDACVRDLYGMLGVDASDGEIRYKWASLAVSSLKRELAAAESRLAELEAERAASDKSVHAALDASDEQYRLRQAAAAEAESYLDALCWVEQFTNGYGDIAGIVNKKVRNVMMETDAARAAREQG